MSKSPWTDIDDAFKQMYTESIVISGRRGSQQFKQTIEAAVFIDNTGDATSDDMMDTNMEFLHICCKQQDWAFVAKLQRGDLVERSEISNMKYKVQDVKRDALMGWCIDARSI